MMAELDIEVNESNSKVTSFEFDVTKDHGLNSESEEEHSDEDKEKDNSGPVKKKKKFKPWKKLRKLFKKENKFDVSDSQNKEESLADSAPSQQQEDEDEDDKLPVSTDEFILSTSSNSPKVTPDQTTGNETQNGPSPSRQRTESDEGLPLSPDSPSLNFDLDVKPTSEELYAEETIIAADEEEQSLLPPNGHYRPTPSPRTSIRNSMGDSNVEFDSVSNTTVLNSDAAKHRISVKPSSRRPSSRYRSPQGTTSQAFDFDVSSLSFASESFDEETEMEQKSAFSASYKQGPMSSPEDGKNRMSGILDQLIEESKDSYVELETEEEEISPSVFVEEDTKDVDEPEKIEEVELKVTFKVPDDEDKIEDEVRDIEDRETVKEIVIENGMGEKDEGDLMKEENEMVEVEEEREEMEIRTEMLEVKETGNVSLNVEEIGGDDKEKEETEDATRRVSSAVEDISVEKVKKDEMEEEKIRQEENKVELKEVKETAETKPSPQPRKKVLPQTVPKVDLLNGAEVSKKGKHDEDRDESNRTLSVKDRISRLQMNSKPVAPVAPTRRSPRSVVTKPKAQPVKPVKAEGSVTSSNEKVNIPETDQLLATKETDSAPKKLPTQSSDPPPVKKDDSLTEMPARGGVKALIMRFQENQSQFSPVQRQAGVVS